MTKTRNRLISVGIALLVLIAAAVFIIPTTTASAVAVWDGTIATEFGGSGDGSSADTAIEISSGEKLAYLAEQVNSGTTYKGKYFKLTDNIDLGCNHWTPIGKNSANGTYAFQGIFDGNGKTISNLSITYGQEGGLFGCIYVGTIKNLCLEKVDINVISKAAAICVTNYGGTIENCGVNSGTIESQQLANSTASGICAITSTHDSSTGSTIINCYNNAAITGTNSSGIVHDVWDSISEISSCLNFGNVTCTSGTAYGISSSSNVNNCYYDSNASGPLQGEGTGMTTAELCSGTLPTGLGNTIWNAGSSDSVVGRLKTGAKTYPSLKGVGKAVTVGGGTPTYDFSTDKTSNFSNFENATPIYTSDEFKAIKDNLAGNYVLMNNIDFKGEDITPIGNGTTPFTGKFSGNGYTISNFVITQTADDENVYAGLFGKNDGTIMLLAAQGKVNAGGRSGGICGFNEKTGVIYGCSFDGSVDSTQSNIGGICGWNAGTISNCFNSAETSGDNYVGGICGNVRATGKVLNCISVGEVNGKSWDGGIFGTDDRLQGSEVSNCYYDRDLSGCLTGGTKNMTGNEFCDGTLPDNLSEDIWEVGSISYGAGDGKFRDKTYTYPSIKGVGKAYEHKADQFNFGYAGTDDYQDYTYISTEAEFTQIWGYSLRWNENYVLKDDITLTAPLTSSSLSSNTFKGKFSGDGHMINMADGSTLGLFGTNRGTIMNLAVKGNIKSAGSIGGICDDNYGVIFGCSFAGKVETTDEKAGGICCNNDGTISNCFVVADVITNNGFVGGICRFDSGPVKSCYFVGNVDGYISDSSTCYYNKDFCDAQTVTTTFSTIQMTSYGALSTMGLDPTIWEKKPNDTANGIAYYPSLKGSSYQPSVMFTKKLELEQTSEGTPAIGSKIEFKTKALVTFKNDFGGDDVIAEDTGSSFKVKVGNKTYIIVDNKIEYTADTAGNVTFTIINGGSDYFPADYSEDVVIKFEKKGLTAGNFTFKPAADLKFNNTAKSATVTTALKGVGKITVKYYDENGKEVKPINAGTYTVKIDVADGDNYSAATDLTSDKWTFTIAKAAAVTITDYTEVSYSWVTDSDETVTVVGLPANMGEVTVEEQRIDSANVVLATLDNDKCYADGKYTFHLGPNTAENVGQAGIIEVRLSTQNYERVTFLVIVTLNSKENQEAPDETAFDVVFTNDGDNLIATIDTKLKGVEYSFDGTTWSTANTKTVGHDVSVTAYIRYAETDDKNASPAVSKTANSGHGTLIHHAAVEATCQHDGSIEYWECKTCGKYYSDEAATKVIELADTVLAKTDHKWLDKYESDKDGHWHKCEYCDEVTEKQSHISSGEATTTSAEYCTECGYIISPKKNGGNSGGHYSGGSGYRDTTTTDTNPAINGTQKSWADIASDLTKQTGGTATISLNGETTVPADVIKAIVDNKITVEIISDSTKSWIIDGSEITTVSSLDLSILPGSVDTGALRGVNGVKLDLSVANVPADLKVAFKNQYAGEFANIYKLVNGKLVFQNCVKLANDGTAVLPDMAAGEYAVMLCKYSDRPGDINNDGILNIADALSLLRYTVGLETGENIEMGDFNGDGKIDLADALAVLRKSVGMTA